ncbi:MAG: helix-turn-helix domain-containing protein [Holophagales bacterium]|jgi:transcriptional regulator with XRE-family HTH domain|nr:helix-turn-helix domain-containing protein [Holophagales bacterium]
MKIASNKINRLNDVFRAKRLAMGLDLETLAEELGISPQVINAVESSDWTVVPSDTYYPSIIMIAKRLNLDLKSYSRVYYLGEQEDEDTRPNNPKLERVVTIAMVVATVAVLAWLLIPAKSIIQTAAKNESESDQHMAPWHEPVSDQPYPVLGEVFPDSPITEDGVLVSLRATDTCTARIVMESGQEQTQVLRMSEPWKLRVKGPFALHLDNGGVVAVEIAGSIVQHNVGVGHQWSGRFDGLGNWLRSPPAPPRPAKSNPPEAAPADGIEQ